MVIWSHPAKADLHAIHDFIAHDSKFYARKVLQDIIEKSEVLGALPRSGRVVPELGEQDIREIALHTYRIIYETRGTDCYVLAVIHKRRELRSESIER
jgi:toxin ParE1/3/4